MPSGGFGLPSTCFGTIGLPAGGFAAVRTAGFEAAFTVFFFSGSLILAALTVTLGPPSFFSASDFFALVRTTFVSVCVPPFKMVFFTAVVSMSERSSLVPDTFIPMAFAFSRTSSPLRLSSRARSFIFIHTSSLLSTRDFFYSNSRSISFVIASAKPLSHMANTFLPEAPTACDNSSLLPYSI